MTTAEPTPPQLVQFARDPVSFASFMFRPHNPADFQTDLIVAMAPALIDVAHGREPAIGDYWVEWTKAGGKGLVTAIAIEWLLMFAAVPQAIRVGARNLGQGLETWKYIRDHARKYAFLAARLDVQTTMVKCDGTGSECQFLTAAHLGLGAHGSRPTATFVDELAHVDDEEFVSTLLDDQTKVAAGLLAITTNAGWKSDWRWKLRELARESAHWHFSRVDFPVPWLSQRRLADARVRNSTARYRRLYHGVWSTGNSALEESDIEAACTLRGPLWVWKGAA